ncbi:MAG TPA: acyl-CoA dehydrogenase [Gammaproteobacteria bacterium]|nr:acyl-CoA dehydrogenase [Gammaproteobacteria bacterium]
MYFGLSEEQESFQESLDKFLEDAAPLDLIQSYAHGENTSLPTDVHNGLIELGINSLILPEEYGGLGLDLLFAAATSQSLGAGIAPAPFTGSYVMAPLALIKAGSDTQKSEYLEAIGEANIHFGVGISEYIGAREDAGINIDGDKANGRALFVLDASEATHYLLADKNGTFCIVKSDDPGLTKIPLTTVDKTCGAQELLLQDCEAEILEGSIADNTAIQTVIDAGRIMIAADSLGAAAIMIKKSVAYAKERKQFGRAIGSFQAVKHMCAQMAADLEPCYAMVWYAAHCQNNIPEEATLMACHAKAHVSEVATAVARTATEVHGGMGFTELLGLHYWFKRIGLNRQILGGPELVREEAAAIQNF